MFDKMFLDDERTLLHRWDLLFAQFRIILRAGRTAPRFRDVLAHTVKDLQAVERDLARFGQTPAGSLPAREVHVWRAASSWVIACREWATPPAGWTEAKVREATDRRKALEAVLHTAVVAYSLEGPSDDAIEPDAVR